MSRDSEERTVPVNDGGPAFPGRRIRKNVNGNKVAFVNPGMSLRDWFAGVALGEVLTYYMRDEEYWVGLEDVSWGDGEYSISTAVAAQAYTLSDAMIAERAKRQKK
jgi:hypothetical protein